MLNELKTLNPSLVAVRSRHPKSAGSDVIADAAREAGLRVVFESSDVAHALRHALDLRGQDTLILATGSLSVAAEVIEEVKGMAPERYPNIKLPASSTNLL
jgi:folylpolyglutamate synthase/dihydropteroate synthase